MRTKKKPLHVQLTLRSADANEVVEAGRAIFGEKILSAMRLGFGGHIEGDEPIDAEPNPKGSQGSAAAQHAAE